MTTNSPSLKILHILDQSLPLHSGYAFRTQNIFRAQLKRGWQPVGLTAKHNSISKGSLNQDETVEGFRYYRTVGGLRDALYRRIREVVEIENPALLHVHSPVVNALAALQVGSEANLPVVYEIRALWEDGAVNQGIYGQNSWEYNLMQSLETWVCHKADQVAVLCHGLADDLVKRGIPSAKLAIVSNGVSIDDFTVCAPDLEYRKMWKLDDKKVIAFIGSFFPWEGLDLLIEAMARLATVRSDTVLLLVGAGRMEDRLKEQVKKLCLQEKVLMPGVISHDRIPGIYALVDILAYPRRSIRLTELVTPLKPLEAMAMSKAVVASDVGGHRELIQHGHTGLLFPAGDVSALAEALACLLDNHELRRKLEDHGYAWVRQKHSWDRTTAVYSDIYARTLEKKLGRNSSNEEERGELA